MIERGDLCCDRCWRRTPLHLKSRLRVPHLKKNYPRYLAAQLGVLIWLLDHRRTA